MEKKSIILVSILLFGVGVLFSLLLHNRPAEIKRRPRQLFPQRIVCLTPSITETVFALGCGDRVVGVTDYCNYPPEARQKVRLGGFFNPNFERLIVLNPDLVISQGHSEKITQFCRREDINLLRLDTSNIESIYQSISLLGRELGCPERARQLCYDIRTSLERISKQLANRPRRRVFFSLYRTTGTMSGVSTVGGGTFISELISVAGGSSIFDDVSLAYPQISQESLFKRRPEVIIEPLSAPFLSENYRRERLRDWQKFSELPAVRNGQIYFPPLDSLLIPGPRIGPAAAALARMIHPEVFGESRPAEY